MEAVIVPTVLSVAEKRYGSACFLLAFARYFRRQGKTTPGGAQGRTSLRDNSKAEELLRSIGIYFGPGGRGYELYQDACAAVVDMEACEATICATKKYTTKRAVLSLAAKRREKELRACDALFKAGQSPVLGVLSDGRVESVRELLELVLTPSGRLQNTLFRRCVRALCAYCVCAKYVVDNSDAEVESATAAVLASRAKHDKLSAGVARACLADLLQNQECARALNTRLSLDAIRYCRKGPSQRSVGNKAAADASGHLAQHLADGHTSGSGGSSSRDGSDGEESVELVGSSCASRCGTGVKRRRCCAAVSATAEVAFTPPRIATARARAAVLSTRSTPVTSPASASSSSGGGGAHMRKRARA